MAPLLRSVKRTSYSADVRPLDCGIHVLPPSLVRKIWPASPTTVPCMASRNQTDWKPEYVKLVDTCCQLAPSSVDRRMVPYSPTANATEPFDTTLHNWRSVSPTPATQVFPPSDAVSYTH